MRIGQNPARLTLPAYRPKRLGIASLVYVPQLRGYFEELPAVIERHLYSMRHNTGEDFDLLVVDNGSCGEVRQMLQALQSAGLIDGLFASNHNMGKTGALNWILSAMPNELLVFSDCDVLFRPGWLEHSLAILEAFPKAGMITAQPDFLPLADGTLHAHQNLDADEYEFGEYRPPAWVVDEYVRGLGDKPQTHQRVKDMALSMVKARRTGVEAVIGATHMQFLGPRAVLQRALPLPATMGLSPQEDQVLDKRVDDLGFLHLSTLVPYIYHMGNRLDETALAVSLDTGLLRSKVNAARTRQNWPPGWRFLGHLANHRPLKGFFKKLYQHLFEIYSQ